MRAEPARPTGDHASLDRLRHAQLPDAPSVLLATDRSDWCEAAVDALESGGFVVRSAPIGPDVVPDGASVDLVIVDFATPHLESLALVRALRAGHSGPILVVVSSQLAEMGVVEAFAAGADGCLTRPMRLRELVTRARTLLRHAPRRTSEVLGPIDVGGVRLDPVDRTVTVTGQVIDLTLEETLVLQALLTRPGRVVPRRELASVGPAPLHSGAVDSLVRRLRMKLDAAEGRRRIETVRGVGFRFLLEIPSSPLGLMATEPLEHTAAARGPACEPG